MMKLLERLKIVETIWHENPQDVYMRKIRLGFGWRIHVFYRMDRDTAHDHPAPFKTFPLRSYMEEYLATVPPGETRYYKHQRFTEGEQYLRIREVKAFRWHERPAEFAHRVLYPTKMPQGWWVEYTMSEGYKKAGAPGALWPIVTIVKWGRKEREWGFWSPCPQRGKWVWTWWRKHLGYES